MHPPRLQTLLSRFDAASHEWLSLDVFDTLLWRSVERPTDVFFAAYRLLADRHGLAVSADAFVRLRVEAEAAARRRQRGGEVTLDEIVAELARALGGTADATMLADAELAAERGCLELDPDIVALIGHAAARGVSYVLVSDMYLPAAQISALVDAASERAGTRLPKPAHVFVSGEHRRGKANGLFDDVLGTLGVAPAAVFHVGDHARADVESPARRGISVFHYDREHGWLDEITTDERRFMRDDATGMDLGLRTLRAKAIARSRDANGAAALGPVEYGAAILGPILTPFAEWVVADCVRHRQDVVHCLMREGHLLAPLIRMAAQAAGVKLEVRTLWASRYALRAAAFHDGSAAEVRDYLTKRTAITIATAARDLGLDEGALRRASGLDHDRAVSSTEEVRVADAIASTPELRRQMRDASAEKRDALVRYFDGEGVFAREQLTLVDLGWAGTIQRTLAQAFREREWPRHVRGLYFATHRKLLELPVGVCSADSFLVHLGEPSDVWATVSRTPEILEQACMPEEGSFLGVDANGVLRHFPQLLPVQQLRDIAAMQEGIRDFAAVWLPGASRRRMGLTLADEEMFRARLRAILLRSLERPTRDEVRLFEHWMHDSNDGSDETDALLGDAALRRRARFMSYEEIRALSWLECYWPQGLARLADKRPQDGGRLWRRLLANDALRAAVSVVARSRSALARLVEGD